VYLDEEGFKPEDNYGDVGEVDQEAEPENSSARSKAETSLSALGEAALQYAARGIRVFPCVPGGKAPFHFLGDEKASTEPEQVRAWWLAPCRT
jgi:hypothetical protein